MNVLVAGGAGYIGSIVAEALLEAGHHVLVYDSLVRGHRSAVPSEATFLKGDLADREGLRDLFRQHQIDAVMHFAAFIEASESMQRPELYFRNNVANSLNLLEASVAAGVRRFVLSSTAAVYRQAGKDAYAEEDPLDPPNAYGESKLMIERLLAWFERAHGLRYASLRYFNAAGASATRGEDHRAESHLIPRALQVALGQREALEIYGTDYPTPDGTSIKDYIHVLDLAHAHLLALEALERGGGVYNVGLGRGHSVREVIEVVRSVTGHPIPTLEGPRRPGDPPRLVARAEKIRRELGWVPRFPELEAIVESAWRWKRDHPHGYPD